MRNDYTQVLIDIKHAAYGSDCKSQRWLTMNMWKYPKFSRFVLEASSAARGYAAGSRASISLFFIRYQQDKLKRS